MLNKKLLFLIFVLLLVNVSFSSILYPTPYSQGTSKQYVYVFYQTDTNTTLAADITRDSTTLTLTDASGFSTPGVLYFPDSGEIIHINSISGNTVTVNRALQYGAGTGRFSHSAGETVVFAHLQKKTGNSAIKLFQDNPHVGDMVLFASHYAYEHQIESIDFKLSTPATYSTATFEAYELNSIRSAAGDMEYYNHHFPILFEDGTKGFTQNGTMSYQNHQTGFPYYYNCPYTFYQYIYDENGNRESATGLWLSIKLTNFTGWTQGPTLDATNTFYYIKALKPQGEAGVTWEKIANADYTTPLQLADETQGLFRQIVGYDEHSLQLKANITSYSSSGDLNITGLIGNEELMAYFPFVEGRGYAIKDYANYRDFLFYDSENIELGKDYDAEQRVYWVNGNNANKKAAYINGTNTIIRDSRQRLQLAYPKLTKQFTIETILNPSETKGYIFGIGSNDAAYKYYAEPFRLFFDDNILQAQLTLEEGGSYYDYKISTPVNTNEWVYITATFDGNSFKLYKNGTLVNSTTTENKELHYPPSGAYNFFLWGGKDYDGNYYKGAISETAVWKKTLSASEISSRNTKQLTGYLQQEEEQLSIIGDGSYTTENKFYYILNLTKTGSYDYKLYQPRLNVVGLTSGTYQIYVDFGLEAGSTFNDATDSKVIIGNAWAFNYRNLNNNLIDSSSSFKLGEVKKGRGVNGGILELWNANAQGTYRNYLLGEYYGTKLFFYSSNIEMNMKSIFKDCFISPLTQDNILSFNEYNFMDGTQWTGNILRNVHWRLYSYYPFYNSTTLEVMPDENWNILTSNYHGMLGLYYQGGWHKGVTVGTTYTSKYYDAYFYHYRYKEVMINPKFENNLIYVYPRTGSYDMYGSPIFGYTYKLKVIDDNGNPVEGAKVYLTDKNGYSAIFTPPGYVHPTQHYIYGNNYGTLTTSFSVNDASNLSVGDIIDVLGERMNITAISGNTITVDRGLQNTPSYSIQCYGSSPYGGRNNLFITKQQPYLITNASGEIPELIIYTDYYKTTTDYYTMNPFTLKIVKDGYEPLDTKFNLTKKTEETKVINGKRGLHPININIVSSTHYYPGDDVDVEVKVTDEYGASVDNATCSFDVYYPDKSIWLSGISTSQIGSTGVYYNNSYEAPNVLGVYTYIANCNYGTYSVSDSKTLEVIQESNSTSSSGSTTTTTDKPGTTTYTCSDLYTQLQNTTYDDGTYKLIYNKCANGCKDGYCLEVKGINNYMNTTIFLFLILIGGAIALAKYFKSNEFIKLSLYSFATFLFLMVFWMYSMVQKGIPNVLIQPIGEFGFSISTVLLIPFLLISGFIVIYYIWKKYFKKRI